MPVVTSGTESGPDEPEPLGRYVFTDPDSGREVHVKLTAKMAEEMGATEESETAEDETPAKSRRPAAKSRSAQNK
jgi:hypothetical protein